MSLAILAHHFIAMGAVSLIADPARPIKSLNLDSSSLAFAIAGAARQDSTEAVLKPSEKF
jgi:NO-binding membrane sensor protein with MHYT domain